MAAPVLLLADQTVETLGANVLPLVLLRAVIVLLLPKLLVARTVLAVQLLVADLDATITPAKSQN